MLTNVHLLLKQVPVNILVVVWVCSCLRCADSSEPLPLRAGAVFPFLLELSPDPIISNNTGFPGKQITLLESPHKAGI